MLLSRVWILRNIIACVSDFRIRVTRMDAIWHRVRMKPCSKPAASWKQSKCLGMDFHLLVLKFGKGVTVFG